MLVILKTFNFTNCKNGEKVFKSSPIIILNNPSHDERSYKVNFALISKTFSDVIDFKNKNIITDIKKLRNFLKVKKLHLKY